MQSITWLVFLLRTGMKNLLDKKTCDVTKITSQVCARQLIKTDALNWRSVSVQVKISFFIFTGSLLVHLTRSWWRHSMAIISCLFFISKRCLTVQKCSTPLFNWSAHTSRQRILFAGEILLLLGHIADAIWPFLVSKVAVYIPAYGNLHHKAVQAKFWIK